MFPCEKGCVSRGGGRAHLPLPLSLPLSSYSPCALTSTSKTEGRRVSITVCVQRSVLKGRSCQRTDGRESSACFLCTFISPDLGHWHYGAVSFWWEGTALSMKMCSSCRLRCRGRKDTRPETRGISQMEIAGGKTEDLQKTEQVFTGLCVIDIDIVLCKLF